MAEDYKVKDGDCVTSVAFAHGFFWETLWNHSSNSSLKSKRKDPNILMPGDVLHIPDLTLGEESGATEKEHKFKLKGVPAKLRLRLMKDKEEKEQAADSAVESDESSYQDPDHDAKPKEQEPRKNVPFVLEVDGVRVKEGQTDGDGRVELPLPPNAQEGRLILNPGKDDQEIIPLALGGMDPLDEMPGVRKRLCNLGFPCATAGNEMTDELEQALRLFQEKYGLDITGKVDDKTKNKLKELHGS